MLLWSIWVQTQRKSLNHLPVYEWGFSYLFVNFNWVTRPTSLLHHFSQCSLHKRLDLKRVGTCSIFGGMLTFYVQILVHYYVFMRSLQYKETFLIYFKIFISDCFQLVTYWLRSSSIVETSMDFASKITIFTWVHQRNFFIFYICLRGLNCLF